MNTNTTIQVFLPLADNGLRPILHNVSPEMGNEVAQVHQLVQDKLKGDEVKQGHPHSISRSKIRASGDEKWYSKLFNSIKRGISKKSSSFRCSFFSRKKLSPKPLPSPPPSTGVFEAFAIEGNPLEEQRRISELEDRMRDFAKRTEYLADKFKYCDVLATSLTVKKEETAEILLNRFLSNLSQANEEDPPVLFGTSPIAERDQNAIKILHQHFTESESASWIEALEDHISAKFNKANQQSHISGPLMAEIGKMQTSDDADCIAFYLISEACSIQSNIRSIQLDNLEFLLTHPKIKESNLLTEAIIKAAKKVQIEAIKQKETRIIYGAIRKQAGNISWTGLMTEEQREKCRNWEENRGRFIQENDPDPHGLTLEGVHQSAGLMGIILPSLMELRADDHLYGLEKDLKKLVRVLVDLNQLREA